MVKPYPSDPEERRQYEQELYSSINRWALATPFLALMFVLLMAIAVFLE